MTTSSAFDFGHEGGGFDEDVFERKFQEFVAQKVQAVWRGKQQRKQYLAERRAAQFIQAQFRTSERKRLSRPDYHEMAERICRAWRRYSTVRIYRYYRDLIRFRERGDPAVLLRAVNPREANMSDAACGVHVRFRLGGTTFPPRIFYKIYTHRPVTDLCAFSPRDYVAAALAKKSKSRHTKLKPGTKHPTRDDSYEGWYKRIENNGWRPVSDRVLVDVDEVTARSAAKAYTFHFDPGVRREEKIKRQKQKQREWMMKMYMDRGRGENGDGKKRGTMERVDGGDDDGDGGEEEDVDEFLDEDEMDLLNWSTTLDFESYQKSWTAVATSSRSEASVPIGSAEWELAVAAENGLLDSMGNLNLNSNAFEALEAELSREPTSSHRY